MLREKCNILPNRKFFLVFGGVLLVSLLALTPNAGAVSFPEDITSDYKVHLFNSHVRFYGGCNTVRSGSGIVAVGPRGSIFGADNNPDGCGYYWNTNQNELSFRTNGGYSLNFVYNTDGSVNRNYGSLGLSTSNDEFLSYNFRSSVNTIGNTTNSIADASYNTISAQDGDSPFGKYIYFQAWRISPDSNIIQSHLTPALVYEEGDWSLPQGVSHDKFMQDVFEHTIYDFGSPTNYIPADLANYIALNMNLASCGGWEACDVAYIISYLPQYSTSYYVNSLHYNVTNSLSQNSIDTSLGGFSQWEIGAGNNSSSASYPKLSYFYLSRPYLKDNDVTSDIIYNVNNAMFVCISATCRDQTAILVKNVIEKHNTDISGWDFSDNTAGSWFDVFSSMSILNPFRNFGELFTANQCVNIPILTGMLNVPNPQYCSWWSQDTRNILTPVISIAVSMLLFGFIVSWLKGSSGNAFKDNDTTKLGDRF